MDSPPPALPYGAPLQVPPRKYQQRVGGSSQIERRRLSEVPSPGDCPDQQGWHIPRQGRFRHFHWLSDLPLPPRLGSTTPLCSTSDFPDTLGFTNSGRNDFTRHASHEETQNTDTLDMLPLPRAQAFHKVPKRRELVPPLQPGTQGRLSGTARCPSYPQASPVPPTQSPPRTPLLTWSSVMTSSHWSHATHSDSRHEVLSSRKVQGALRPRLRE